MKLKSIILTVAVLAVLSLAVWYVQRPSTPLADDPRVGQPLAAAALLGSASQVRITDQGKTVTLVKNADGSWTDTAYHNLPGDFAKLTRFIDDLVGAKLQRLVTTSPERIARLEFKDTAIAFLDSAGKELWSVNFGKNADTGGGRFVRFGTEQKAYLASYRGWLDSDPKSWANTELLNLKADDVARIGIPFDDGVVTVSRAKKDAPWIADHPPAGQKLKEDRIASLLPTLANVRFTDVQEPTDPDVVAAKAHERTFDVTTFDGKNWKVAWGRKPGEKHPKPPAPAAKPAPDGKPATDGKPAADGAAPVEVKPTSEVNPPAVAEVGSETAKNETGLASAAKPATPAEPEFDVIPPGPVFVTITNSDAAAPINGLMAKNAFRMADYVFTGLPQKPEELFEPAPVPAPVAPAKPVAEAPAPANPPGK